MKRIQIIYEDDLNDVDIIAIPNYLCDSIYQLAQLFLHWIPPENDKNGWVRINGQRVMSKETVGFVTWLSKNYCQDGDKAYIVNQHTNYCDDLDFLEF